jgi:predicted nucleotidyltransferase
MNFHSDEWIMARLQEHYDEALTLFPEDRIVGIFLQGSQNYGLDIEDSDIDTKLIVVPTWEDICFNRKPVSTTHIRANDEHIDLKDIRLYIQTFRKQNLNFVEILFTPYKIINPRYVDSWNKLVENREAIARYNPAGAVKTMKGIALEKFHAMEHRYASKIAIIDKYGYDCKQLHHLFRVEEFLSRYIAGVPYEECLVPKDCDYLKDVKQNLYGHEEAKTLAAAARFHVEQMYDAFIAEHEMTADAAVDEILNSVQCEIMEDAIYRELNEKYMQKFIAALEREGLLGKYEPED